MLTREQFLSRKPRTIEKVEIPELSDHVFVRSLTGAERDAWEDANLIRKHGEGKRRLELSFDVRVQNSKAHLVCISLCDESGNRTLQDGDVAAVGDQPAIIVNRIADVCMRISGLTEQDLEDSVKN
jgi:hypothetical protein